MQALAHLGEPAEISINQHNMHYEFSSLSQMAKSLQLGTDGDDTAEMCPGALLKSSSHDSNIK